MQYGQRTTSRAVLLCSVAPGIQLWPLCMAAGTLTQLSHLMVCARRTVTCERGDVQHLTFLSVILDRLGRSVPQARRTVVVVVL